MIIGIAGIASATLINGNFETTTGGYAGIIHGYDLDALGDSGNGTWDVYKSIDGWETYSGPGIEIKKTQSSKLIQVTIMLNSIAMAPIPAIAEWCSM